MIQNCLNNYSEIQHLSRKQQEAAIQQAKYEAYTTLNLGTRGILFLIVSLALAALSALVLPRFISMTFALLGSIAVFIVSYHALARSITSKGLKSLMARQAIRPSGYPH